MCSLPGTGRKGLSDSAERRLIAQIANEDNCNFIYHQIEKQTFFPQVYKEYPARQAIKQPSIHLNGLKCYSDIL